MIVHLFWFTIGICVLIGGAEGFIAATQRIAGLVRMRPATAGIFIIGFGTSMPELVTSVEGALLDSDGVVIGNIVGSNIANLLLLAGIAGCLIPLRSGTLKLDLSILGIASLIFTIATFNGYFGYIAVVASIVLIAIHIAIYLFRPVSASPPIIQKHSRPWIAWGVSSLLLVTGFILMLVGANIMIERSITMARLIGLPEVFIGLTAIALGTSLPELGAIWASIRQKQSAFIASNIIGSCIFNLLLVLPIAALFQPLRIAPSILHFDLWVMNAAYLALAGFFLLCRGVPRLGAIGLIAAHVIWLGIHVAAEF